MSSTGRYADRSPGDFYQTPAWCVKELYKALDLPCPTLDPCAGTGALVRASRDVFRDEASMRGVEKNPDLVSECPDLPVKVGDGLALSWEGEHLLMNPPYSEAEKWVYKATSEASTAVVLLRIGFLASKRRKPFLERNKPAQIVVLSSRPSFTGHGTDSCDYAWFVWRRFWPVYKGTDFKWIVRP